MKHNTDEIVKALSYDPLAEAEKLTGKSYKESEATSWLGMGLAMTHNARKKELLQFAGDTYFGMPPQEFITKLAAHGFVKLLEEPFVGYSGEPDERPESLFLYWEPIRGILVKWETYGGYPKVVPSLVEYGYGASCNSISFYFNWRAHKSADFFPPHVSGGMVQRDRDKWVQPDSDAPYDPDKPNHSTIAGSIDGREGMFNAIDWMDERGTFETPWVERPSLWLLNYAEKLPKELDQPSSPWEKRHQWYEDINERRPAKATHYGHCVDGDHCGEMGCCCFGCCNPKLPVRKETTSRKRRLANIEAASRRATVSLLSRQDTNLDAALEAVNYLSRLARKAP